MPGVLHQIFGQTQLISSNPLYNAARQFIGAVVREMSVVLQLLHLAWKTASRKMHKYFRLPSSPSASKQKLAHGVEVNQWDIFFPCKLAHRLGIIVQCVHDLSGLVEAPAVHRSDQHRNAFLLRASSM